MIKILLLLAIILLSVTSCKQKKSKADADYIKNLEEKNLALEKELHEEKNKIPIIIDRSTENAIPKQDNYQSYGVTSTNYFTIGSTEDDVIEVMGNPTRVLDLGNRIMFYYDFSSISLKMAKLSAIIIWTTI